MGNFVRICPRCNEEISYKHEGSFLKAESKKSFCRSCTNKTKNNSCLVAWERDYGKEGSKLRMEQMIEKMTTTRNNDPYARALESQRKSKATKGSNNPMHGKSLYSVWLATLGEEEADKKRRELNAKRSKNATGENNPMFGKPSPLGSGNGWKGWYKDIYFASLNELYYLKYLLDNNISFENGEKKKYKIPYSFMNKKWNYFLDFYLSDTDEYVEIKPRKLVNSPRNLAKFKAAREKLGDKFKVLTEDNLIKIDLEDMYNLYLSKDLIFMEKYIEKFLNYYEEHEGGKIDD